MSSEVNVEGICFGDMKLSDLVITVEGQKFHVHKMVLAARSEYFKALFYGEFQEKNKDEIEITDTNALAFRRFLEFMYNGIISDDAKFLDVCSKEPNMPNRLWEEGSKLIELADRFSLTAKLKVYVARTISNNSCHSPCKRCFNAYIFSLANHLSTTLSKNIYPFQHQQTWSDEFFEIVPTDANISIAALAALFSSVETNGEDGMKVRIYWDYREDSSFSRFD